MDENAGLVPRQQYELAKKQMSDLLLQRVRPVWQSRRLIERVKVLLPVDPSSACQRLLNAAIHDLREKVLTAGTDIAKEIARDNRLPPIERPEDIEEYPTARLLELCYKMGILTRQEWRKLTRCYDIRRDLEHEDDEYEAGLEDCIYIFTSCVDIVLSRDPIPLLMVTDIKDVIEQPIPFLPSSQLLEDYKHAPRVRQEEIGRFLISGALDASKPELVRQNCIECLRYLELVTPPETKIKLGAHIQQRIGRGRIDFTHAEVAHVCGALPYLRQTQVRDFFEGLLNKMLALGSSWRRHTEHTELLDILEDVGGFANFPPDLQPRLIKWLVLVYIGEPGRYGWYGRNREVFYSDTAVPIIERLFRSAPPEVLQTIQNLSDDRDIKSAKRNKYVGRRFESVFDLFEVTN